MLEFATRNVLGKLGLAKGVGTNMYQHLEAAALRVGL